MRTRTASAGSSQTTTLGMRCNRLAVLVSVLGVGACGDPPPASLHDPSQTVAAVDTLSPSRLLVHEASGACEETGGALCDSLLLYARRVAVQDGAEIEHDSLYAPFGDHKP